MIKNINRKRLKWIHSYLITRTQTYVSVQKKAEGAKEQEKQPPKPPS